MSCFIFGALLPALADFGVTDTGGSYTVDTDAGLVFRVNQANGDITSLKYRASN